jgi:ribosome-binding factor A
MAKERVLRINELIKRELNSILLRELDFPRDTLITLTRVETSSNLIQSKVYVSVMPERQQEKVLIFLNKKVFDFQQLLNRRLRIRPAPRIIFVKEKEIQKADKVEKILEKIIENKDN